MSKNFYLFLVLVMSFGRSGTAQPALLASTPITAITQSPDGTNFVTGHQDGTARLWDARSNRIIRELNNATPFESITLGRCRRVFYVQPDVVGVLGLTEVRLFNPRTSQRLASYESELHLGATISSNGQFVILNVRGQTHITDLRTGSSLTTLSIPYQPCMNLSADGRHLFYQRGQRIEQIDVATGKVLRSYERSVDDDDEIKQIILSTSGKKLISVDNRFVHVWDLMSGKQQVFSGESFEQAIVSATDDQLVAASSEEGVFVYNVDSGKKSQPVQSQQVSALAFNSSGNVLFWADEKRLNRLNLKTGTTQASVVSVADVDLAACVSPDSRYLLFGTEDGFIKYFDLPTATYRGIYRKVGKRVRSLRFQAEGRELEIGDGESVDVIQVATGRFLRRYEATHFAVDNLDFSDSRQKLVVNSAQGYLTLSYRGHLLNVSTRRGNSRDYFAVDPSTNLFDGTQDGIDLLGLFDSPNQQIKAVQLKEQLYKPGLLAAFLAGGSTLKSLGDLNLSRGHPTVTLTAEPAAVRIQLTDQGGGIGRVVVYLNRKLVLDDARPATLQPTQSSISIRVDLSRFAIYDRTSENQVEVQAYNHDGYLSSLKQAIAIQPSRQVAADPIDAQVQRSRKNKKPTLYALLVGVSDYANSGLNLHFAAKDADDMHQALSVGSKPLFGEQVHLYKLTSNSTKVEQRPTGENIRQALAEIEKKAERDDVLLLYFAGHGQALADGQFYFLSAQARSLTDRYNSDEAVSDADILKVLQASKCQKQVLILDACYSGKLIEQLRPRGELPSTTRALERMRDRSATYILASSTSSQRTWEATEFAQGLLTHFLLEGMRGPALEEGGIVAVNRWLEYAKNRVEQYTQAKEAQAIGNQEVRAQTPEFLSVRMVEPISVAQFPDAASRGQIPLNEPRAVVCRSTLLTDKLGDPLELRTRLNEALANASTGQSLFHFFDYDDYPGGYRLVGTYRVNGTNNQLTINQLKILQGNSEIGVIELSKAPINPDEMIDMVIRRFTTFCQSRLKASIK